MTGPAETETARKGLLACFAVPLGLLAAYAALAWFDTTTELTPGHEGALNSCFFIAGLAGLAWGALSIRESKGLATWRRVPIVCCLTLVACISISCLSSRSADLVNGYIDFPKAQTRTFAKLLVIWRAYQTHGKSGSWNIQTTPIWSDLDVTQADYDFMLLHRSPMDRGRSPDEIASHGFFCARVTVQQAGNAMRILHAGNEKLPAGTVVVCPSDMGASDAP